MDVYSHYRKIYAFVKGISSKYRGDPAEIRSQINKRLHELNDGDDSGKGYDYLGVVVMYLNYAFMDSVNKDPDAIYEAVYLFENVFAEDLKRDKDFERLIPSYTLQTKGINDLNMFHMYKASTKCSPLDDEKFELARRQEIDFSSLIYDYAKCDFNLLLIGETGTSKGLMAKVIHGWSSRSQKPYRKINCAALPETLLESELFGNKKGAFTGASADRKGLLETLSNGTLFLDELGKMPKTLQAKLLGVLEDKEFYPLGGVKPVAVDVRFVASAQPIDIEEGNIYTDLLYRLNYPLRIELPCFNERIKLMPYIVIEDSASRVMGKLGFKKGEEIIISDDVFPLLQNYNFVGGYRELEAILMGAIISAKREKRTEILPEDFKLKTRKGLLQFDKQSPESLESSEDIKLKDIFIYAEKEAQKIKSQIIREKVFNIFQGGKDVKQVLLEEGLPLNRYDRFTKDFKKYAGKGIRELKRNFENSNQQKAVISDT